MFGKIAFFILNAGLLAAHITPVKKCDGASETFPLNVTIFTLKGVCISFPCEFPSGSDARADIEFTVKKEVTKIKMMSDVNLNGNNIPYPLPDSDEGCSHLSNTYCPIEPDTDAQIEIKMHIAEYFPKVSADVKFYLLNQDEKMISCFTFPAKIV